MFSLIWNFTGYCTQQESHSTQIQPVLHQSQPGHNPHGYNPVDYKRHYHWAWSHYLSVLIQTLAINRAQNTTQGHKNSYQTSYQSGSKCHTGTMGSNVITHWLLVNRELSSFFIAGSSLQSFKFFRNLSSCLKYDLILFWI